MIKFSIIIPVYNVEKYIEKCLQSVFNQTYNNYECILVCDKSTDNSDIIVDKFIKLNKKINKITAINTGLSEARNIGVNASSGEYILFLDGDDYYEKDFLETINSNLFDQPDLLRFQVREVYPDKIINHSEVSFDNKNGIDSFDYIKKYHFIENAWAYCYKTEFYLKNEFSFMKGCVAEDFGLIPLIIAKANKVKSINYIGYNYIQREGSLMSNKNYNHKIKKMDDMIFQAKNLYKKFKDIDNNEKFLEFINNSLIYYSTTLKYCDFKRFKYEIKELNVYDYIPNNNFKRKIKKMLIKGNAYIFYNFVLRYLWRK
ncbi:MAG: glycosyltransferase family 2 protein [Mollicutes bacterium]|nr:glycosyltransferase family 2 protein [Mollicutes bacterium]